MNITETIAERLGARADQVEAAVALIDQGATVPFIARYRKEATGGLDDSQLRDLQERLVYLRELADRRETVLRSIAEQGKLTDALEQAINQAETKTALEDLYLPYKPRRRTRAQIAREAGLAPLAERLLDDPSLEPLTLAAGYLDAEAGFADPQTALDGARQILMERFAEDAALAGELRERLWSQGRLRASVVPGKEVEGAKFRDYFEFSEALSRIPSHRALALLRGRNAGVLDLELMPAADAAQGHLDCERILARRFAIEDRGRPADPWLQQTARLAWRAKLYTRIDLDLKLRLREAAEQEAIAVFARNLKDLLLAAPAGARVTLGLDPGLRSGVKAAVVDATGKLVETATLYPHAPQRQWQQSLATLKAMVERHAVELLAIGNGTASRETEKLAAELVRDCGPGGPVAVLVSEAGASVYSASALAAREFPALDVSLRGAVSIARRLQDPLAELVKIEPRSIGVGQYQHDVNQGLLGRSLEAVVEDCVNAVGVDVNTASSALLARVSGLSQGLAENIVAHRDQRGPFRDRRALMKVPRLGARTFEQAAGFLRIVDGDNPLDASAVHPEAYPVVQRILADCQRRVDQLMGDGERLRRLDPSRYTDERFGLPTVTDIIGELEKPGRDPRPEFRTARFQDGIETLKDLREGMILEGVVSNVTNFGAFVDVGVHQDGLVHVSQLADRFVRDPREVVKAGDIVKARVLEVDTERRRIALSLRLEADRDAPRRESGPPAPERPRRFPGRPGSSAEQSLEVLARAPAPGGRRPDRR